MPAVRPAGDAVMRVPGPLRHAVRLGWCQVNPATTPAVDAQFREPTGTVDYTYNVIAGQLGLRDTDRWNPRPGGDVPQADGHVVLRVVDMPAGFAPRVGDRVTQIAVGHPEERAVEWHVVEVRPQGHYRAGPTLWFCFYRDLRTLSQVP